MPVLGSAITLRSGTSRACAPGAGPLGAPGASCHAGLGYTVEIPPPPAPPRHPGWSEVAQSFQTDWCRGWSRATVSPPTPGTSGWDAGSSTATRVRGGGPGRRRCVLPALLAGGREPGDGESADAGDKRLGRRVVDGDARERRAAGQRLLEAVRGPAVARGGEDGLALRRHLLEDPRLVGRAAGRPAEA